MDGLAAAGAKWVQIDGPVLVKDLTTRQQGALATAYDGLAKAGPKIMRASYFGALRGAAAVDPLLLSLALLSCTPAIRAPESPPSRPRPIRAPPLDRDGPIRTQLPRYPGGAAGRSLNRVGHAGLLRLFRGAWPLGRASYRPSDH
ncbi:hypothetical protein [Rhodovulum sulfidophilum]|uniref:hypothetical protein n=1 Tax=Rhodovulum sulfidophilum TaxID=35806 RepID=UPI003B75C916